MLTLNFGNWFLKTLLLLLLLCILSFRTIGWNKQNNNYTHSCKTNISMPKVNIVSYILLKKYEFKQIRPLETHTFSDIIGAYIINGHKCKNELSILKKMFLVFSIKYIIWIYNFRYWAFQILVSKSTTNARQKTRQLLIPSNSNSAIKQLCAYKYTY